MIAVGLYGWLKLNWINSNDLDHHIREVVLESEFKGLDLSWVDTEELDLYLRPDPIVVQPYFGSWARMRYDKTRWKNPISLHVLDDFYMEEFLGYLIEGFSISFKDLPKHLLHPQTIVKHIVKFRLVKGR